MSRRTPLLNAFAVSQDEEEVALQLKEPSTPKLDGSAPIPLLFLKTEGRPVPPSCRFVDTCRYAVLYPKVLQLSVSLVFPRSGFQSVASQFTLSVRPFVHQLISFPLISSVSQSASQRSAPPVISCQCVTAVALVLVMICALLTRSV